ncbi:NADP-dependent oxidoreductase [Glaciihabitans sp. INWT7]|uniref:NADP-dependent oxidoreductase n=1 Tax=Glaciihabitans sp. INWT7 TaxID=2596912 RepID=UPI0016262FBB|nr:NADP-dependent oxidoreductase [Glaciihabitans sp. INWT7]QNE47327.1 NADP-dependent oxidoreductase [Glaciihabitans sp. INWT7]
MDMHWIATDFGGLEVFHEEAVAVPRPRVGEVTIQVRAAGMNPADFKHIARGTDRSLLPIAVGYEVAGVITAMGADTMIASGGGAIGDEVIAFRVQGGYASAITVAAKDVFAKPPSLGFPEAANLLLAATTASEMLHVTGVVSGETVLVHGASGAVGVSVIQQAVLKGIRVIGTASESSFPVLERFGAIPVAYGEGLEQRVRDLAPEGIAAALDNVGTDEAVDVSLALVEDRSRIVTIAAMQRAEGAGIRVIMGAIPASAAYRDAVRAELIALAGEGKLEVPLARTFPLSEAVDALTLLSAGHPGGKLALIP